MLVQPATTKFQYTDGVADVSRIDLDNWGHDQALLDRDDPLVLMNTSAMLEDLGHEVVEATSGKQALDVLRQKQKVVDLVIADQAMPNMTGTELIKALRVDWPDLPIILATGYAELPPGTEADLKLAKPFGLEELAHALADVISQNGTASPRGADEDRRGI